MKFTGFVTLKYEVELHECNNSYDVRVLNEAAMRETVAGVVMGQLRTATKASIFHAFCPSGGTCFLFPATIDVTDTDVARRE